MGKTQEAVTMEKIDRRCTKEIGEQKLNGERTEDIMDKLDEIVDWINKQDTDDRGGKLKTPCDKADCVFRREDGARCAAPPLSFEWRKCQGERI